MLSWHALSLHPSSIIAVRRRSRSQRRRSLTSPSRLVCHRCIQTTTSWRPLSQRQTLPMGLPLYAPAHTKTDAFTDVLSVLYTLRPAVLPAAARRPAKWRRTHWLPQRASTGFGAACSNVCPIAHPAVHPAADAAAQLPQTKPQPLGHHEGYVHTKH